MAGTHFTELERTSIDAPSLGVTEPELCEERRDPAFRPLLEQVDARADAPQAIAGAGLRTLNV